MFKDAFINSVSSDGGKVPDDDGKTPDNDGKSTEQSKSDVIAQAKTKEAALRYAKAKQGYRTVFSDPYDFFLFALSSVPFTFSAPVPQRKTKRMTQGQSLRIRARA